MSIKSITDKEFLSSLTKGAAVAIITGTAGYLVSTLFHLKDDPKSIAVGFSVLVGALAVTYFRQGVSTFSEDIGKHYMNEKTGIVKVFKNLEDCEEEMRTDFKKARDVRLLLQVGRRELGGHERSFFWNLAKERNQPGTSIRVLRAAEYSPFLSEERAKQRKNLYTEWQFYIHQLTNTIRLLRDSYHVQIEEREHCEPFLWRIFIFDDIAYVSAYLYPRDNDKITVVYRLRKGETSLFTVFSKYFDYLWIKYDSTTIGQDTVQKWVTWE